MSFRETYGGMVEAVLNNAVDEHLDAQSIKDQLHKAVDELVDSKLADVKRAIKVGIDKIDGEVDLK